MIAPAQESNLQTKQSDSDFQRLIKDLQTTEKLLSLENYSNVTLEELNDYLRNHPIDNNHFGLLRHFYTDREINRLVPARMVTYGKEKVAGQIAGLLYEWIKWNSEIGGRMTTSQGAFILGTMRDVRMPDVAYTPRNVDRNLNQQQQWTYQGEPFSPTFVVEIDTLTGSASQRGNLDIKMKRDYFPNGIMLGWLIDPEHKIMIVYKKNADTGEADVSEDTSWRNLYGDEALPGFVLESLDLDLVLNQQPGSSSEDEMDAAYYCRKCNMEFKKDSEMAKHSEWHRSQAQKAKFLRNQQH
ncbi:hypothetical protein HDV04_001734 [Boothiomyces sp. JEL0838]|nr:hypothetical protein HDV04_001734 [Boothiomyces sp. JEL0838]